MLRDIANSDNPIQGLVTLALETKGAETNPHTVSRYTNMLKTALEMDSGKTHRGEVAEFIEGLPGKDKFEAVVRELGSALNASENEVDQFFYVAGSVGAIIDGDDPEIVEQEVADFLDAPDIPDDDGELYSHLQEHEREMRLSIDEYNRKQHESEVHHLEEVADDDEL